MIVVVITELAIGRALFNTGYYNSLLLLSSFLLVLALGQGTVILTGGLDLSVPWTIALCGILLAGIVNGQNGPLVYALPLVLVVGCLALRWSFMGPFETIDLNAPAGVRDYVTRYQQIYSRLFPSMQRRVDWAGEVIETVERDRPPSCRRASCRSARCGATGG